MANPLMLAALEYEAKGFSVIPLKPKDKTPLLISWAEFQVGRAEREQIGAWWRQWPKANIGIVTGAVSNLSVIDCDSPDAATNLKPLLGDLHGVGIASTGKGFHLYYNHSVKIGNKAGVREQIDFRGEGGYVVAPPSIHPNGATYQWATPINGALPPLPEQIVKLLTQPQQIDNAEKVNAAKILGGVAEGQRDTQIFKFACSLRAKGFSYENALEICEFAASKCVPPFTEWRKKVDQAYKYPAGRDGQQEPVQDSFWPVPLSMAEFNKVPVDEVRWAWHMTVPFGEVAMICGEPRAGKTTLALNLALAVSRGVPFLGRSTVKAPCFYVALDNSYRDMKVLTDQLHIGDHDEIIIHTGAIPKRSVDWVLDQAVKAGVKLVVIDTVERFYPESDINKPEFGKAMIVLDAESKKTGIAIMYVHHATAHPSDASKIGSLFMGHTTVKGMSPYYMELYRVGNARHRMLSTDLRSGRNIESLYVQIDQRTGWCVNGGGLEDALMDEYSQKVVTFVATNGESTRSQIREAVEGRKQLVNMAITNLIKDGKLERVNPEVNNGTAHHPEILTVAGMLVAPKMEPELRLIK